MSRLTSNQLKGIWAGIPMSWDDRFLFDETNYRKNIEIMCRAGVHGIYTTGSSGEFYSLEFDEFKRMVDIQVEICSADNVPLQIGCGSENTRKTLQLLEYVADKSYVGTAQIHLPYWMELTDRELLQFFKDLYITCPDMPLVHYNIPRAKRFLFGQDYQKILDVAPSLIGVKFTYTGAYFDKLQEAVMLTPTLSYFVSETLLASGMMLGARGAYSALVYTNPRFMLTLYEHAANGRWQEAVLMQKVAHNFVMELISFVKNRGEGYIDPVFDHGIALASGCLAGSQRTRAPYIGWSDETVTEVRKWIEYNYPQFMYSK